MSDRIAIYNEGRIEQIGTGEDLFERPVSLLVADFVGESNIYPGTLRAAPFPSIARPVRPPIRVPPEAGARVGLSDGDRVAVTDGGSHPGVGGATLTAESEPQT